MLKISAAHLATASLSLLLVVPPLAAQSGIQSGSEASPSLQASGETAPSAPVSKIRIVRLSQVKGEVQFDSGAGRGFEPATANLPVVEDNRLQTGKGVAEVEFEDNSSLRLAPDSIVEFPKLERLANGATLSSIRLVKGMAYVSLMKTRGNEFNLLFGQQSLALPPSAHVRLQLDGSDAKLAVLGGDVSVESPTGTVVIPHKKTVTFSMLGSSEPTVAKDIAADPFDTWDHSEVDYHDRSANVSAFNSTPYAYGLNDMSYYGDFADLGGCGMMWRPYFASAAWSPYSNGAWAWYGGGAGYSWVSPYPWGWTPYHFGSWSFCPGIGYGWMPGGGGGWMGLNNAAGFAGFRGPGTIPRVPVHPPRLGEPGLMMVNQRPLVQSGLTSSKSFVFRKDSAGLGIPRDELGKLRGFSERADSRGSAHASVYIEAPASVRANGRATIGENGQRSYAGVSSMRRGSPAAQEMPRAEMGGGGRMSAESAPRMSAPSMSSASSVGHASAPSGGHGR